MRIWFCLRRSRWSPRIAARRTPITTRTPARSPCATSGWRRSWPMPRSRRNRLRRGSLATAVLLTCAPAWADPPTDQQRLAGDYFVGASVFLFERTVLAAFAPADSDAATLDAGVIVLAREKADSESGSVALQAVLAWLNAWLTLESKNPGSPAPPEFDAGRRHALACLAYGADADVSTDLANHIALGADERKACTARYLEARKHWLGWLESFRKSPGAPAPIPAAPDGAPAGDE